jgi:uncharacterized protein
MSEKNKEIVKQVDASFENHELEGFLSHCAEDIEWTMVGEKTTAGKDAVREWMTSMGGHEAPKINSRNLIAEGEMVAAHGEMAMKNESGETVNYTYCDIYRFKDGKISELTSFVVKTDK